MDPKLREADPGPTEDPLERAQRLAARYNDVKRHELAEREARHGLGASPRDQWLHFELARSFLGREKWKLAAEQAQTLVQIAPQWPVALNLLSILRAREGNYAEAERLVLDALRLAPQWAALYETYGDLMRQTGHEKKARRLYEKSRELDPESADVHAKLALLESERLLGGRAEEHAKRGLQIDAQEPLAQAALGAALIQRGRPFAARRRFREALRLDPGNESYEAAWLEADRCCRCVYLPMYYWSLVLSKVPGRQFTAWFAVMFLGGFATSIGLPNHVFGFLILAYLAFCIYTWFAGLLLKGWLRLRPPNLDFD